MDLETTQAIEGLGGRIDELGRALREDIRALGTEVRDEIGRLGNGLDHRLALNWSRTQVLFEDLRDDIRLLADAVANLSTRNRPDR